MFNQYQSTLEMSKQMNNDISKRHIPTTHLQPYLNVRPVNTKYELFPIVNTRKLAEVNTIQYPTYDTEMHFCPATRKAPNWSAYVNVESVLRNQVYALQKNPLSEYVPHSNSTLYHYSFKSNEPQQPQIHTELFREHKFDNFNPNINNIGYEFFNNNTRMQLNNI